MLDVIWKWGAKWALSIGFFALLVVACSPTDQTPIEETPTKVPAAITPTTMSCSSQQIVFREFVATDNPANGLFVMCLDDGVKQRIGLEGYVSFAPDSGRVVYVDNNTITIGKLTGDFEISPVVALDSTTSKGEILFPDWSPDEQYISYTEWEDDSRSIKTVHIETGTVSEIVTNEKLAYGDWSPTGTSMIYFLDSIGQNILYLSDVVCDEASYECTARVNQQLQTNLPRRVEQPSWSHDGARIVAVCFREQPPYETLCILEQSGNIIHEFDTLDLSGIRTPTWSYDKTTIAFSARQSNQADPGDIYLLSLDDQTLQNLTNDASIAYDLPVWIP